MTQPIRVHAERAWQWGRWLNLLLIPILLYLFTHHADHTRIEEFMEAGPRFSASAKYKTATELEQGVIAEVLSRVPPPVVNRQFEEVRADIAEIKDEQKEQRRMLERLLARN